MKNITSAVGISLAALVIAGLSPAMAQTPPTPFNGTLTTTPQQMTAPYTANGTGYYQRIWNVSPAGGTTAWCSRSTAAPAPNTGGSFPLAPGAYEELQPPARTPKVPTYCVGAGAVMTTDVY